MPNRQHFFKECQVTMIFEFQIIQQDSEPIE
jgi:hypothetical protein